MKRIVLTGGPGSGKTVISNALAKLNPRLVAVAEAATQVYESNNTRWDRVDIEKKKAIQRQIYSLQVRQEEQMEKLHPDKILLLDRGTIDGAAYWPDGADAYWRDIGTTQEEELARYDQVILLQTAAAIGIYDGAESNRVRFENAQEAIAASQLMETLWCKHPRLIKIPAFEKLADKIAAVSAALDLR